MGAINRKAEAIDLHERGFMPLPLRAGSKHLDLEAMGYCALHFQTQKQKLKELAFASVCFQLSQRPPSQETVAGWFHEFRGNIGILGGYRGVVLLDFDRNRVFDAWFERYGAVLAGCPMVASPRGHHVIIRCDTPMESSSLYFGRKKAGHLKSLGGYTVAPTSVLQDDRRYVWRENAMVTLDQVPAFETVAELGLAAISPLKDLHDKWRGRGSFVPE